jgi:hypothetical protein
MAEDPATCLLKFENFATGQMRKVMTLADRLIRKDRISRRLVPFVVSILTILNMKEIHVTNAFQIRVMETLIQNLFSKNRLHISAASKRVAV